MNEKAWLERYARAYEREQARERQARERAGACARKAADADGGAAAAADGRTVPDACAASEARGRAAAGAQGSTGTGDPDAGCSTLELIKRKGARGEGRRVDAQAGQGWQIAEVERLLGLPRRDIQRACYEGQGGAGLVHPKESSWGKRSYDAEDLARLYQVRRQRDAGLSLPEVRRVFDAAEAGPGGWERFEADQLARAREAAELAAEDLAQARALRAATGADRAEDPATALDAVIDGMFLHALAELRFEVNACGGGRGTGLPRAGQAERALRWFATRPAGLAGLWFALEVCRQRGLDSDAPETRSAVHAALAAGDARADVQEEDAGAREETDTPPGVADAAGAVLEPGLLAVLLENSGMELALELRLGPGGFDYALRALRN